ncbi:hypothetical protein GETHOR_08120 [Geothrix oryzae]|uniref:Uncharacterized protein n=1 Tax=Geothrix oryzae TaxID=2927975 RepID=A0ABM8DP28_9BACT|nr:hypothetical protein [Geothrix oryzae]BDU68711.1 hypothetical protein GETHOR_08120 [Geothrix oryzae]
MAHIAPLGITCVTIDAFYYALIETDWALSRRLETGLEGVSARDSRSDSVGRSGLPEEQDHKG